MFRLSQLGAGDALSAEKLSVLENIPRAYVDQIFQRLRHAGLVESVRGAHGGYTLARPPQEISLGMMMRAVEGYIFEDVCERYSEGDHQCRHTSGCGIRPVWMKLTEMVESYLDRVTLADLLSEVQEAGAQSPAVPIVMRHLGR